MKELADISTFTNLMNQSQSTPVQNGFMDKAKKALYPALIGGSLLGGGGLVGYGVGHQKGHNAGYDAGQKAGYETGQEAGYGTGHKKGYGEGYIKGWSDLGNYNILVEGGEDYSKRLDWLEDSIKALMNSIGSTSKEEVARRKKEVMGLLHWCDINDWKGKPGDKERYAEIKDKLVRAGIVDGYNPVRGFRWKKSQNPYFDKNQLEYDPVGKNLYDKFSD